MLVLIVLGVWVLKVFFKASTSIGRGRNRRLSIVDSMMIDPRRQLIIVRRDDVEHLILTGGPQDVVVETGITVDRQAVRRPGAAPEPADRPDLGLQASRMMAQSAETVVAPQPSASVERLRDLGRSRDGSPSQSLRHTGLLRPISRHEPAVIPMSPEPPRDNLDAYPADSARTAAAIETGQAKLGGGRSRFFANIRKTDRN